MREHRPAQHLDVLDSVAAGCEDESGCEGRGRVGVGSVAPALHAAQSDAMTTSRSTRSNPEAGG